MAKRHRDQSQINFAMSIDLIDSTKIGLGLRKSMSDELNQAVVAQIQPHLAGVKLKASQKPGRNSDFESLPVLLKYEGDGWLAIGESVAVLPRLCCLALILGRHFREDVTRLTGLDEQYVPSVRIGVTAGRDCRLTLPDGRHDWCGESVRRAVRVAAAYRMPNCVLVDEVIRQTAGRDFEFEPVSPSARRADAKWEEELNVHWLRDLNHRLPQFGTTEPWFEYANAKLREATHPGQVHQGSLVGR